jgi:hypothetical protein
METKYEDNDVIELLVEREFPFGDMKRYNLYMHFTTKDESSGMIFIHYSYIQATKSPKDLTNDPNFKFYCEPNPISDVILMVLYLKPLDQYGQIRD